MLDTILDRTVVAGYTRVGYRMRRGTWSPAELRPMDGKVVLVTGATSGLGLAAAEGFARLGATVWLLARGERRGERARAEIVARSPNADVGVETLRSQRPGGRATVRRAFQRADAAPGRARQQRRCAGGRADVLGDGIELTFATNVLGPFLLTNLLVPLLQKSKPARIVNVSSGGMYTQRIHLDDLQMRS